MHSHRFEIGPPLPVQMRTDKGFRTYGIGSIHSTSGPLLCLGVLPQRRNPTPGPWRKKTNWSSQESGCLAEGGACSCSSGKTSTNTDVRAPHTHYYSLEPGKNPPRQNTTSTRLPIFFSPPQLSQPHRTRELTCNHSNLFLSWPPSMNTLRSDP